MQVFAAMNERALTIRITGELDATTVPELRALLEPLVDQVPGELIVDIEGLRLIDSSGVGVLVYLYRRLRSAGHAFAVRGAAAQPLSILRLMKLDRVFSEARNCPARG